MEATFESPSTNEMPPRNYLVQCLYRPLALIFDLAGCFTRSSGLSPQGTKDPLLTFLPEVAIDSRDPS
jgi:hypothetical protein